jgi:hypothetical protein
MIYVGSAERSFTSRWNGHILNLKLNRHGNWMLQWLFNIYGIGNLDFYMIEVCPPDRCLLRENYYIQDLDPELNLTGTLNSLGLGLKSIEEKDKLWDEWMKTEKGREYKRNTIGKKRLKWVKTPVGRQTIKQDIKNLRDRLNNTSMTEDEKVAELLRLYREYFPTKPIKKETLIKYLNDDPIIELID